MTGELEEMSGGSAKSCFVCHAEEVGLQTNSSGNMDLCIVALEETIKVQNCTISL